MIVVMLLALELVLNTLPRLTGGVGKARVAGCRDALVEGLVGEEVVAVAGKYMADEEVRRVAGEGKQGTRITEYCWMQQVPPRPQCTNLIDYVN